VARAGIILLVQHTYCGMIRTDRDNSWCNIFSEAYCDVLRTNTHGLGMREIKLVLSVMELAVKGPGNRRNAAYSNFTKT